MLPERLADAIAFGVVLPVRESATAVVPHTLAVARKHLSISPFVPVGSPLLYVLVAVALTLEDVQKAGVVVLFSLRDGVGPPLMSYGVIVHRACVYLINGE
jgi:hypothetical protein